MPPLPHRGDDGGKIVVRDDHIGGALGDVGARNAHRDADIRLADAGRVVDSVARHGDDVARLLELPDDHALVLGTDAREHASRGNAGGKLRLAHPVQLRARDDLPFALRDTEAGGDGVRRIAMVARDHDGRDARRPALGDRLLHPLLGRVDHAADADEDEFVLPRRARILAVGEAEHAQGSAGEAVRRGGNAALIRLGERADGAARPDAGTAAQNHVAPALDEAVAALRRSRGDGHHLAFGCERNAAQPRIFAGKGERIGKIDERDLRRVAHAPARRALDGVADRHAFEQLLFAAPRRIGEPCADGFRPRKIGDDLLHRHAVFGEGARLIRTDTAAPAQRFDGVELAHDGALAAHLLHPERHDDGDDGGHALGNRGNGDRHRRHEVAQKSALFEKDAEHEDDRRHRNDERGDDLAEHRQNFFERGLCRFGVFEKVGDLADLRVLARAHDDRLRLPLDDERRGVQHVLTVENARLFLARPRVFGDADRFARERGFVAFELLGAQDAAVGGNHVPLLQVDDVAGDEEGAVEQQILSAAHRFHAADGEGFELFDGVVGAVLLNEADKGIQKDDEEQNARVGKLVRVARDVGDDGGDGGSADEQDGHKVLELRQKQPQRTRPLFGAEGIFAELFQPLGGLLFSEPQFGSLQFG